MQDVAGSREGTAPIWLVCQYLERRIEGRKEWVWQHSIIGKPVRLAADMDDVSETQLTK